MNDQALLRLPEVMRLTGYSRSSILSHQTSEVPGVRDARRWRRSRLAVGGDAEMDWGAREGARVSRLFPEPEHATPAVIGTATGQFEADRIIDGIRSETLTCDLA